MMPGSWADHGGRIVQVLRIEGGKTRNWGSSPRTPRVVTVIPWNPDTRTLDGQAAYTITDPLYPDLRACEPPKGYQALPAAPTGPTGPTGSTFYASGEPW